jgi:hypothetical protein
VEQAVRDAVDVDLGSAVVAYRPAAGEERSVSAREVSSVALFNAAPWRTFRWYFGQRHYSGTYWSATQRDHVIYESRLELANLLLADFDPAVHQIVAQPFVLHAEVDGRLRRHIPDYLWDTDDEPVVVDVVRGVRLNQPKVVLLCAWTRQIVESLGWSLPGARAALAHTAGVHAGRYRGGIGDPAGLPDSRARSRGTGWPGSARE